MGELTVRMTWRGRHVLVGSGSKCIVDLLIVPRRQAPLSSPPLHARAPDRTQAGCHGLTRAGIGRSCG